MNQRINSSIANEVAVDLLGHREMHACRASMPVVALSRVPVQLDAQRGGSTPPTPTGVKHILFTWQRRLSSSCCLLPCTHSLRGGLFSLREGLLHLES